MNKRQFVAAALVATAVFVGPAHAEFPDRTIEVIFPWPPGATMSVTQIVAKAVGEELGVSLAVISTPGAGGTKAFKTALSRPADGYTIFDGYVAPLVLQPILGKADWTYKDFKPLQSAVSNAFAIGIRKGDPRWETFEDLMEYGKANPGKLRYTTSTRNNLPHMVIAKVLQTYGVVAQNVPYKTYGDATKDLASGVLDFAYINVAAFHQDKDAFEVLLVLSELDGAKDSFDGAPSIADLNLDLGLSGLAPMGWTWWLVRKETPEAETKKLREAMKAAMAREDVRKQLTNLGFVPLEWGPEDYATIVGPVSDQLQAMDNALKWEEEQLKKLR